MFTPTENPLRAKGLSIFTDNFSEKSSSIKERVQDKREKAVELIKKFASGYDSTGSKITVDLLFLLEHCQISATSIWIFI